MPIYQFSLPGLDCCKGLERSLLCSCAIVARSCELVGRGTKELDSLNVWDAGCWPLRQAHAAWSHIATHPMLTAADQASRQELTLELDWVGEPQRWTARLRQGEKLAFLTRVIDPDDAEPMRDAWTPHSTATETCMRTNTSG